MSNKEENFTQLKKKKESPETSVSDSKGNRRRLIKWAIVVTLFLMTGLLSFYFTSSYRLIDGITVEGSKEVYDQTILDSSGLEPGESIWENYLNKSEIEEKVVEADPQIRKADLTFSGIQGFTIHVEEYKTVAYLSNDNTYKKILENGVILEETVPRITAAQPILNGFEQGRPLELMITEYEDVDEEVKRIISEIDYLDDERNDKLVHVFMNDGNEVLVSIPVFSERLNYYHQMKDAVDNIPGLFDLEAGAYFVPFSAEEEEGHEIIEEFE